MRLEVQQEFLIHFSINKSGAAEYGFEKTLSTSSSAKISKPYSAAAILIALTAE